MKILAIDLAWDKSGWVFWDSLANDPVISYGEIKTKETTSKKYDDTGKLCYAIESMRGNLQDLIGRDERHRPDVVVYEYTDWHQGLSGRNFKQKYAQERSAQRTLSRAETILLITCLDLDLKVVGIGAMEARTEFCEARRKDAAARFFAAEYSYRFKFQEDLPEEDTRFLIDTSLGQYVSDHISDAFIIAAVYEKRARQAQMIEEAA
jgi:hypothetical protein